MYESQRLEKYVANFKLVLIPPVKYRRPTKNEKRIKYCNKFETPWLI